MAARTVTSKPADDNTATAVSTPIPARPSSTRSTSRSDGDTIFVGDGSFTGANVDRQEHHHQGHRPDQHHDDHPGHQPARLPCDSVNGWTGVICIEDSTVTVRDLIVDGDGEGNLNNRFSGILYARSGGLVSNVEVTNVQDTPMSGAQKGYGIAQTNNDASPTTRKLRVFNSLIHNFQKAGIQASAVGSPTPGVLTLQVDDTEVTGAGPTATIGQNGITAQNQAKVNASGNEISDLADQGPTVNSAAGILLFNSGMSNIEDNTFDSVQTGINAFTLGGTHVVNITGNTFTGTAPTAGPYKIVAGVSASDGRFTIEGNTFDETTDPSNDASIGIELDSVRSRDGRATSTATPSSATTIGILAERR